MTDSTQELDEILFEAIEAAATYTHNVTAEEADYIQNKAKQALTSLIKELVAEAKPGAMPSSLSPENYEKCERVANQYHQNLLKALEEV